ncbi:hypothetical protein PYCCODRAFT_1215389 [Trametes coccinea BRFM310]|uniref:Uncharacterized protein n=1 Tax=Trametes coccinea (strain BRFM310) TaxID=1353009 RepID=A0A1Y2I6V9_TRAC3|nr:hypothetical protein PYCCODRAFT_1215389 [Trametes coccinea BRFM310]
MGALNAQHARITLHPVASRVLRPDSRSPTSAVAFSGQFGSSTPRWGRRVPPTWRTRTGAVADGMMGHSVPGIARPAWFSSHTAMYGFSCVMQGRYICDAHRSQERENEEQEGGRTCTTVVMIAGEGCSLWLKRDTIGLALRAWGVTHDSRSKVL